MSNADPRTRQLIEQTRLAEQAAPDTDRKQNAEVLSYDPTGRIALVAIDGDEGYGTYAANTTNDNLSPGQRVRVEFRQPHGVEVVGTQSAQQMIGCKWGSLGFSVGSGGSPKPWTSGFGATYDPYGIFDSGSGVLTVPSGFSGIWTLSMVVNNPTITAPRIFTQALTSDGFLYRNAVPLDQADPGSMEGNVWAGFSGKFLAGGDTVALTTFQNSGITQNFFAQVEFWLTTPGVIA